MRAYLGWKHHEAPWGEYYNSTHHPSLDPKLVHDHSIAHQNVAILCKIKDFYVCVCEGGGGEGGSNVKKLFLVKQNQLIEQ